MTRDYSALVASGSSAGPVIPEGPPRSRRGLDAGAAGLQVCSPPGAGGP